MLREVTVKIGLERIYKQEGVIVEVLLDSKAIKLVIILKFVRKQGFKFKKNRKTNICGKYEWFLQQEGTY